MPIRDEKVGDRWQGQPVGASNEQRLRQYLLPGARRAGCAYVFSVLFSVFVSQPPAAVETL